jgi:hypothetical protein
VKKAINKVQNALFELFRLNFNPRVLQKKNKKSIAKKIKN